MTYSVCAFKIVLFTQLNIIYFQLFLISSYIHTNVIKYMCSILITSGVIRYTKLTIPDYPDRVVGAMRIGLVYLSRGSFRQQHGHFVEINFSTYNTLAFRTLGVYHVLNNAQ